MTNIYYTIDIIIFNTSSNTENIDINKDVGYSIYVVYTHTDFIDAGKIFMQNNDDLETDTIIKLVNSYIHN